MYRVLGCGLMLILGSLAAHGALAPNGSFESGEEGPTGWRLSGGDGIWQRGAAPEGTRYIEVRGTGQPEESNYWRSAALSLKPGGVYQLSFHARRVSGSGGCPISGPAFANRDLEDLGEEWQAFTSYFMCPSEDAAGRNYLRFGQWEVAGAVAYDGVELWPSAPVYAAHAGILLGAGEQVHGDRYVFQAPLNSDSFNHARCVADLNCHYNRPRLLFGSGTSITYRHDTPGVMQASAEIAVTVRHHHGGVLVFEGRVEGGHWTELGRASEEGAFSCALPASFFPSACVYVRLRGAEGLSCQVHAYGYDAALERDLGVCAGQTHFVTHKNATSPLGVAIMDLGLGGASGEHVLVARIQHPGEAAVTVLPTLQCAYENGLVESFSVEAELAPGESVVRLPFRLSQTGAVRLAFSPGDGSSDVYESQGYLPHFFNRAYGRRLPGGDGNTVLWWASSGWKIPRERALPEERDSALVIRTARNEAEAAQLVITPRHGLEGVRLEAKALAGPAGAVLPAACIELLEVGYVPVTIPTDRTGVAADWPDPLPPIDGPLTLAAGQHHPFWVRVKPPAASAAGVYRGVIGISAAGFEAEAPLEVEVFDFTLPEKMQCATAFGFSAARAFAYHGVTEEADQRAVYAAYLEALSAHHISPYTPAALDPLRYSWPEANQWAGGVRDREGVYDGASSFKVVDASEDRGQAASCAARLPIPESGLRLRFAYRCAEAGTILATLLHYDAAGQWMSGRNTDMLVSGGAEWQVFDREITDFPAGAKAVTVRLWPCAYAEDGSTTGTAWFDGVRIVGLGGEGVLLEEEFEPLSSEALQPVFDWDAWDGAMEKALETYHFTSFQLPIPGMGGGTFYSRTPPSLLGYGEETLEYQAAFRNYCQAMEAHLEEKGWLEEAFVYWFDEPDPKDYDFVNNGFRKLKAAAPKINRMLTEQIEEGLIGGPNIWCPLTPHYDMEAAAARRAAGERFWWYVCTGPKAPYATLFIDHPGTELRVWAWQSWKRKIVGLLIWESNYWTSSAAYPDPGHPQNPYTDPMGWRTGYGTPAGVKAPWGNGDGRFLYPPVAAADGRPAAPVLDAPVASIRLEMLRDGIEDYEYFALLEAALEEKGGALPEAERVAMEGLLGVPEAVSAALTDFTLDPAPMEAHRRKIAAALAELGRL